jgi:crossover junction endodeoxyribonuclease RusA
MTETAPRCVSFTVAGLPAPQGSKRAFVNHRTGKPVVLEMGGAKLSDWRSAVRDTALGVMLGMTPGAAREPLAGPLSVSLAFTMRKPKSAPRTRRTYPDKRPDLDKLVRAVLDGLTGPLFADDAQVIFLSAWKLYPDEGFRALPRPGVMIAVKQIGEDYG